MAQFESMREPLEKAGLGVAFIAGQARRGLLGAQRHFQKNSDFFPYLCDERRQVLRDYGVYRALGGWTACAWRTRPYSCWTRKASCASLTWE